MRAVTLQEEDQVFARSQFFSFHEYAMSTVAWFFEERGETGEEIESGVIGTEEA